MLKRMGIIILVMVVFSINTYAAAATEIVMERSNTSLVQRTSEDGKVRYSLEIMSDCSQGKIIFLSGGFAFSYLTGEIVTYEAEVDVKFQVGPKVLGHVTMQDALFQSLVFSKDQESETIILEEMVANQEVLFVIVDTATEVEKVFAFNIMSFLPVLDKFVEVINAQ